MLVLSRRKEQVICIGDDITITVVRITENLGRGNGTTPEGALRCRSMRCRRQPSNSITSALA